jgi:hypothetical protein
VALDIAHVIKEVLPKFEKDFIHRHDETG